MTTTKYPNFDASKSYIGECQVCGQFQVVKKSLMVLHGYKRPGDGQIDGRCPGENHVPFELSCEVAKAHRAFLVDREIPNQNILLAKLSDPKLQDLTISVADGYYANHRGWGYKKETRYKFINIGPGYVHVKGAENDW